MKYRIGTLVKLNWLGDATYVIADKATFKKSRLHHLLPEEYDNMQGYFNLHTDIFCEPKLSKLGQIVSLVQKFYSWLGLTKL